jgi:hypothetical protein
VQFDAVVVAIDNADNRLTDQVGPVPRADHNGDALCCSIPAGVLDGPSLRRGEPEAQSAKPSGRRLTSPPVAYTPRVSGHRGGPIQRRARSTRR